MERLFRTIKNKAGTSIVELLLVFGLSVILLPAVLTGLVSSREGKAQQGQREKAVELLRQTDEAIRSIRRKGWTSFAVNGTYHPIISGSSWSLASGSASVSGFIQSVLIADSYRDNNNQIASSPGRIDPSTKKVTTTISWSDPYPSSASATTYLTRYLDNLTYTTTTQADFDAGTKTDVVTTNTSGGEVVLGPGLGAKAKWCEPSFSPQSVDLPEVPTAVTAIPGDVYVSMGNATSHNSSFARIGVTTDPLTFTLKGRFDGGYNTTAVYGDGSYGYIALGNTSGKRVAIISLTTYTEVGSFSVSGYNYPATSISVYNNRGYVTIGGYLYVFDLSSKTGSRPLIGSRILFSTSDGQSPAKETFIRQVGSKIYVFVAIDGPYAYEMGIIDVTKETNPNKAWGVVGQVDIDSNHCSQLQKTKGVYVKPDGTRAYISDANANDFKEFFVINTEDKTNPFVVGGNPPYPACTGGGGWESGGLDPKQSAVTLPLENRAIVVGTGGTQQYVVLDVASDEAHPTQCGGLAYPDGIYGVASAQQANGDVYAFLITGNASQDLKVVQGGPDVVGGKYLATGTYESATFDPGYGSAFNRFWATVTTPTGTDVKFQVAIADAVSGSCTGATFNYVGPDGSSASYFSASGSPIAFNSGRCFRYKAFLSTTDTNQTPVINDVTVNYSP